MTDRLNGASATHLSCDSRFHTVHSTEHRARHNQRSPPQRRGGWYVTERRFAAKTRKLFFPKTVESVFTKPGKTFFTKTEKPFFYGNERLFCMEHTEHMEIERKFLIDALPEALNDFSHQEYLQGYLSTSPTLRVRREGETYVLTFSKSVTVSASRRHAIEFRSSAQSSPRNSMCSTERCRGFGSSKWSSPTKRVRRAFCRPPGLARK